MIERSHLLPKEISESIVGAYNALNDREGIKSYYKKLYQEVVERMLKKGKPSELILLARGEISQQALNVVLVQRLKQRGDNKFSAFVEDGFNDKLKYPKGNIDPKTLNSQGVMFRAAIKHGPFIDKVFDDSNPNSHGAFTHMMQRDITHQAITKATNGNPKVFWDFLGSPKGVNWWVDLFDSANPSSFTRPEAIRKSINDNLKSR